MTNHILKSEFSVAASQYYKESRYWAEKLSGELVKVSFPNDNDIDNRDNTDRVHVSELEYQLESLEFTFLPKISSLLLELCKGSHIRLHMILVAGILALLHKYTGHTDIIVGSPVLQQESDSHFINTVLLLRNEIRSDMSFREVLREIRQTITEATIHQNYPLDALLKEIQLPIESFEKKYPLPFLDICIILENIHQKKYLNHIPMAMLFSFFHTEESIKGKVEYSSRLYRRYSIERIIDHLSRLMGQALIHLDVQLNSINLYSEEEKKRLLYDFNETRAKYPVFLTIHRMFEQQVERSRDVSAIAENDDFLTYSIVNKCANCLARVLMKKGVGPDTPVAMLLENSLEAVIAILGILKAGGTYLPIDPELPESRKIFLIKDSKPRVFLIHEHLYEHNHAVMNLFTSEQILTTGTWPKIGDNSNLDNPVHTGNLCYVIYTSGTTGKPKGVMVEHRGLVNYIYWAAQKYTEGKPIYFPLYSNLSFDLTVTSIFTPLITGGEIIVYRGESKGFFLDRILSENRVDIIKLTPSHLELISHKTYEKSILRQFIVGGEAFETQLAAKIHRCFGDDIRLYNEYGPTEAVVGCMFYRFHPEIDNGKTVPIGTPVNNVQIYILDSNQNPMPIGAGGELCISGDGMARGYLNRPELTSEKFVMLSDRFYQNYKSYIQNKSRRFYRTGDLVRFLKDGNVEFLGRFDRQIKIRGYRVELSEIENKLKSFKIELPKKEVLGNETGDTLSAGEVIRCRRCILTSQYPGIKFDDDGICSVCHEYDEYKNHVDDYFLGIEDFLKIVRKVRKFKQSSYDCLLLYSGGKDSSYVLYRLVDMGLKVLTFTFDNGYISQTAFDNIKRTTTRLGVENIIAKAKAMDTLFVESLNSNHNVCNGCWNALNSISAEIAGEKGIHMIISGLSRGQIFDMRLHGLFQSGIFSEEEIQQKLLLFRKSFHSKENRFSRVLKVDLPEKLVEKLYFVDFFRYDNTPIREIKEYLSLKGWQQPGDTGFCSSNCIINDVGIYMHIKYTGYHSYEPPLSWDIRLDAISREEGLKEIGFKGDIQGIRKILRSIGYYDPISVTGAVVVDKEDNKGNKYLSAYYTSNREIESDVIREYLSRQLPHYMIPLYFIQIDEIPLTSNGKVNFGKLPAPEDSHKINSYSPPRNEIEKKLAKIWSEVLGIEETKINIGMNFFAAGGNSLSATIMTAKINKQCNVEISLTQVFRTPTLKELGEFIIDLAKKNTLSLEPVEKKEYYSLSSSQKRLYFLQQMDEHATGYNISSISILEGKINKDRLEKILKLLVYRHESLRTSFVVVSDKPFQKIDEDVKFGIEYHEITHVEQSPCLTQVTGKIIDKFIRSFDLSKSPLFRVGLIQETHQRQILMVDMHHIISDGMSVEVLIRDFVSLYTGEELLPVKLHYKDFAEWQNNEKEKEKLVNQQSYWKKEFETDIPVLELPLDYVRPMVFNFEGSSINFELSPNTTLELKALATNTSTTLYMVLLAIYYIFLGKISNQEDIVIGTPVAGRKISDLEKIIGMFVNTLALRNYPKREISFSDFLEEVKENTLKALENQDYPYEDLVKQLILNRDVSRNPLFDTLFTLQNFNGGKIDLTHLKLSPYHYENKIAKFDLTLTGVEENNMLLFTFEYSKKIFKRETIERFIGYFINIVYCIVENKNKRLSQLELMSKEEKNRILYEFNDTAAGYPRDKTLFRIFFEQVERSRDSIAAIGPSSLLDSIPSTIQHEKHVQISYKKLYEQSNELMHFLYGRGVIPDTIVGISTTRSLEMLIGVLGILNAGCSYLPLDPEYPKERIDFMIKDSGACFLLTNSEITHVNLSKTFTNTLQDGLLQLHSVPSPFNLLAYIIYTSGSTGKPKGVAVDQNAVVNLLIALQKEYPVDIRSTYLLKTSYLFDVSVTEIFGWYMGGGKVVLLGKNGEKDPLVIIDCIKKHFITHINFVPSMFNTFIDQLRGEDVPYLSSLKYIFSAGEALLSQVVNKFYRLNMTTKLENIYGPTECTVYASRFSLSDLNNDELVPIGKPLSNIKLYIFDGCKRLQPLGVAGELYIAGFCLARGYINRPDFTAEKFLINSPMKDIICNEDFDKRIYSTGDRARWRSDGNVEYLGRSDTQVKIRGFRVELGEIENRLLTHIDIKQALVLVKEDVNKEKRLYAYIVTGKKLEIPELYKYLAEELPGYMIPSHFVRLNNIPLTPNGKVDRNKLELYGKRLETGSTYQPAQNDTQKKIISIWKQILQLDKIGIHDNYFEVGGSSFDIIRINKRMREEFQIEIPIPVMFRYTSVYSLERYLNNKTQERLDRTEKLEKGKIGRVQQSQKRREARRKQ